MKLRVVYELSIDEQEQALIPVIASIEGWSPDSGVTPQEHINTVVAIPQVGSLFQRLVEGAIDIYFGIAGKAQASAVKEKYKTAHTVTSEFIND